MQRSAITLMLGAIVVVNAGPMMASEGERLDAASARLIVGHSSTFAGIRGCEINLQRAGGNIAVRLAERWCATAVGSCPSDPVYGFSLRGAGETAFSMQRGSATNG